MDDLSVKVVSTGSPNLSYATGASVRSSPLPAFIADGTSMEIATATTLTGTVFSTIPPDRVTLAVRVVSPMRLPLITPSADISAIAVSATSNSTALAHASSGR